MAFPLHKTIGGDGGAQRHQRYKWEDRLESVVQATRNSPVCGARIVLVRRDLARIHGRTIPRPAGVALGKGSSAQRARTDAPPPLSPSLPPPLSPLSPSPPLRLPESAVLRLFGSYCSSLAWLCLDLLGL